MNYQQLEKIFGPPLMDQPLKQLTAHKPQINIIQILIALGIGYFFIKGVIYFFVENQIFQFKKVDVKKGN
jgi:hypothetical protein